MDEHAQWSDDAAAYALGALDPDESARFEDHFRSCARCRTAMSELRSAALALPLGAPQLPAPRRLRRRILSQVEQDARARRRARQPGARQFGRPARALSAAGAMLAAAAVITIVAITGSGTSTNPPSHSYPGRVTFARGSAAVRVRAGTAELVVDRMPAPPAGKVYEVWIARHGRPAPTDALFDVTAAGRATVAIPAGLRGASAVMVTAEPRGGSRHPTSAPVIDVPLS